jgi:type IV secretion system protein VirD4
MIGLATSGTDLVAAFAVFEYNLTNAPFAPLAAITQTPATLLTLLFTNLGLLLVYILQMDKRNNYKRKKEHGSAHFAKPADFDKMKNPIANQNIILSKDIRLSLDHHKTGANINVLVTGGPGSGKTRGFMKPLVAQMACSMVITDAKGNLLASCGKMLRDNGYKIKVLNLADLEATDFYNPFTYMRLDRPEDIMSLIEVIIKATDNQGDTSGKGKGGGDSSFWENAEKMLLLAIFFYILEAEPKERQSIPTVLDMMDENRFDAEKENPLAAKFDALYQNNPRSLAVSFWKKISNSNIETMRSVVAIANARFSLFQAISHVFSKDTLELDKIDSRKTAIFVTISPANSALNFIATMFYTQLFQQIDYIATQLNKDNAIEPSLNIPLLFMLDEFANIPKIPNFLKMLAYARSLNVGIIPIFQSLVQAKEMYGDSWETIVSSCDTLLFLGGDKAVFCCEYIAKLMGKETIDSATRNKQYGKGGGSSRNESILARDLMTADEIARLKKRESIIVSSYASPIVAQKYDVTSHPNYCQLAEAQKDEAKRKAAVYTHYVPEKYVIDVYVMQIKTDEAALRDMWQTHREETNRADAASRYAKATEQAAAEAANKKAREEAAEAAYAARKAAAG